MQALANCLCLAHQILWLKLGRTLFFLFYKQHHLQDSAGRKQTIVKTKRDLNYYSSHIKGTMLDVGCGDGQKTRVYREQEVRDVTGIDLNRNSILKAHNNNPDLNFVVADAEHLPLKRCFDVVVSNDALEHIPDLAASLREMKRVLVQNGKICVNFGPLWCSPFGCHLDFNEFFVAPWLHLFFSENAIKKVLVRYRKMRQDETVFQSLNKITVSQFEQTLDKLHFGRLNFRLHTYVPFHFLLKTPLRDFFTTQVVCVLS